MACSGISGLPRGLHITPYHMEHAHVVWRSPQTLYMTNNSYTSLNFSRISRF